MEPRGIAQTPDCLGKKLEEALAYLQRLYNQSSDIPDEVQVIEAIRKQLPQKTRDLFDFYADAQDEALRAGGEPAEQILRILLEIKTKLLASLLEENHCDWTLTTPGYPIYSRSLGQSVFKRYIRSIMQGHPTIEDFQRIGVVFFDGNGVKSIDACIGYDQVTKYLKRAAQIFTDPQGPTRRWLDTEGISITPMSVGGDEFALLLCSQAPLSAQTMEQIVKRFQEEIAQSEDLCSFLDFNNRDVLINFSFQTEQARMQFDALDAQAQEKELLKVRSTLPAAFSPSFSGGKVTLDEVIADGMIPMNNKRATFDTTRELMFDSMMRIAEARQAEDKKRIKEHLKETDDAQYQFMLRTPDDRTLSEENSHLREEIDELKRTLREKAGTTVTDINS